MAKILKVDLLAIPKVINVSDDVSDITVVTTVQFHALDIQLEMPYCLHIYVYDIRGHVDVPLVLPNWDESQVLALAMDRKDDFLGIEVVMLTATSEEITIKTPMALQLGQFNREMSYTSRKIKVFATMAPIVGRASKYSEPFSARLSY